MIKQHLDLTATDTAEDLFNLPTLRIDTILSDLDVAVKEIAAHYESYSFDQADGPDAGRVGLHAGKILERVLRLAQTPQEELFIFFYFKAFMETTVHHASIFYVTQKIKNPQ